jgi:hypothetical protein
MVVLPLRLADGQAGVDLEGLALGVAEVGLGWMRASSMPCFFSREEEVAQLVGRDWAGKPGRRRIAGTWS